MLADPAQHATQLQTTSTTMSQHTGTAAICATKKRFGQSSFRRHTASHIPHPAIECNRFSVHSVMWKVPIINDPGYGYITIQPRCVMTEQVRPCDKSESHTAPAHLI